MRRQRGCRKNATQSIETYNVTGTIKINEVNIEESAKLQGAVYSPEISPSVDVYVGGCLFRLFSTGTISCFGSNRKQVSKAAIELFARLRTLGVSIVDTAVLTFHSESSTIRLGRKLLLRKANYLLKGSVISKKGPRLLSLRLTKPEVTMQLFEDGTITCLGAKNSRESKHAFSQVFTMIEDNRLTA
jgi:TATA-box binding protein (TBP) (component of TFIID and TFIIIB)